MRLKQSSHLVLGRVPQDLCDRIRRHLDNIDWSDRTYGRTEITLKQGRVIEMPYYVTNFYTLDIDSPLALAIAALVNWIQQQHLTLSFLPIRCEIASLPPGTRLELHRDQAWFHSHSRRMHVPLITNQRCWHSSAINEDEQIYHMNADVLYELNNIDMHTAVNDGEEHRIHVVADFMPLNFFQQSLEAGQNFKATVPPGLYAAWLNHK